jgi:hypothetical protein
LFFGAFDPILALTFVPLQVSHFLLLHLGLQEFFPNEIDMTRSLTLEVDLLATHFEIGMSNQYFHVFHVADATSVPSRGR